MDNFELSVQRFDEFAEEYANRFDNISGYIEHLSCFCRLVEPENPRILELGCGPGNVTRFLKASFSGSRIVAIDLAPRMIEIARAMMPEVDFRVMDVRNISSIHEKFEAIMCSFCLPFLSKADAAKLIADCSAHLNPGGVVYLSTMEGDENRAGFETTSFSGDSQIYFNYHRQQDLETEISKSGFVLSRIDRQEYVEPDGSITIDLIFIAVKK